MLQSLWTEGVEGVLFQIRLDCFVSVSVCSKVKVFRNSFFYPFYSKLRLSEIFFYIKISMRCTELESHLK